MSSNWVGALDNLAAGGVIDFDAPAFILDKQPRYIGNPRLDRLPLESEVLPPGIQMKKLPEIDEFSKDEGYIQNPAWKKWAFGGLVLTVIGGITAAILTKGKGFKMHKLFSKIRNTKIAKFFLK